MSAHSRLPSDLTPLHSGPVLHPETGLECHSPALEGDARWQLACRITASKSFAKSAFLTKFLLYVCARSLTGRADEISEQQIGVQVFGRRSDYNPGEDNIVRNYARQLRQRLDLYFEEDGGHEELRIVIPRGGYTPVFVPKTQLQAVDAKSADVNEPMVLPKESTAAKGAPPTSSATRRNWVLYTLSVVVLVAALVGWGLTRRYWERSPNLSHAFWSQIFDSTRTTYIVPADDGIVMFQNLTKHLVPLAEYVDRGYLSSSNTSTVDRSNLEDLEAQRYTSVTDLNAAVRLSGLPERHAVHTVISYARELHIQDLKDSNAILVGSKYSNPWVELFEKNLNFQFNYEAVPNQSFIRNTNPQNGEFAVYRNDAAGPSHRTYAVIAMVHNLNSTGWVLILEGLTMAGTQATVDTVLDPNAFRPILERARSEDGTFRPFEVLIETRSFGSNSPQASIVATRFYPK